MWQIHQDTIVSSSSRDTGIRANVACVYHLKNNIAVGGVRYISQGYDQVTDKKWLKGIMGYLGRPGNCKMVGSRTGLKTPNPISQWHTALI